jgi:hypothetical protein
MIVIVNEWQLLGVSLRRGLDRYSLIEETTSSPVESMEVVDFVFVLSCRLVVVVVVIRIMRDNTSSPSS